MLKSWGKAGKWITAAILLSVILLFAGILHHEITLETAQQSFLALLEQKEGYYHSNRIVLSATNRQEAEQLAKQVGGTLRITKNGVFAVITLPDGMTVAEFAAEDENREYLGRMALDYNNFSITTETEDTADGTRTGFQVVDEMYPQQNYLDYINIGNTWNLSRGETTDGEKITIAIIDSGIDTDHPEFTDAEGNSIINIHSYDASNDKTVNQYGIDVIEDTNGHGTAVAGVIAAQMNEVGIVGIAPDVDLLIIKCDVNEAGEFTSSADIVFAIYYAIEMDVDVINMSLGGDGGSDMQAAIQLAVDSDIICVAAAGNDATDDPHYPAAYDMVIGVGALTDNSWAIANYSNYGINSDIVAPGTALTTAIGGGYTYENGTSMAAPIVSASVALYLSQNEYATYDRVKAELLAAGKDLGDLGEDDTYGFGALDLNAFVCEEKGTITYDYCTEDIKNTTQVFVRQHTIQTVPEPERDNIILDDWYYDKAYTRVFDYDAWYSTEFVEDVTLYAKWVNEDDEGASVYNYQTLSDGTIEIVSYKGKRRYLTIPNEIDGKIVSSIGSYAFSGNTRLREVVFPEGLVYIKEGAFYGVSKMREITFTGTQLLEIQKKTFYGCSALKTLNLPESVQTIGESAFGSCSAMTTVNIPTTSSLVNMGVLAFSKTKITSFYIPQNVIPRDEDGNGFDGSVLAYCSNMRTVSVHPGNSHFTASDSTLYSADRTEIVYYPAALTGSYAVVDGVTTIGDYAFAGSSLSTINTNTIVQMGEFAFSNADITQVTLSENLTEISEGAFSGSKLVSVYIPNKLQTVEDQAFFNCVYLKELTFGTSSELKEILGSEMYGAFAFCRMLGNFTLPDSLQTIGERAFYQCTSISKLTIPVNVNTIEQNAFQYCTKLQSLAFADNCVLATVPQYCFANCTMLQSVVFSDGITKLDNYAFRSDQLLYQLNFGDNSNLATVGDYCFYSCSSLQTMQLPESVTTIGQFAYTFSGLRQVDISDKLSSIGKAAFGACYGLTYINVDEENTAYASVDNVLFDKNITTVYCVPSPRSGSYTLPETVTVTAQYSFYYDIFLTTVVLPEGLTDIQENSFYNCSLLADIEIPANVTNIGRQAFENCYNLAAVSIGENSKLQRLGIYTFVNCGMTEITIPSSVEEIAQYAFYNCNNLKKITFEENSALTYISAYLLSGTKVEDVVFEEGSALTSLQAHAFDGARYLKSVDFGDAKITNLDNYTFYNCSMLEFVNIPDSVTYIGRYAFYNCAKLSRMDLPAGMDYIGESAFYGTSNMKVYFAADALPDNVQIGWDNGIAGYFLGAVDYIVTDEWEYTVSGSGNATLAAYMGNAAELTIDTIDGYTVTKIGTRCFAGNDTLTSITLSENITEIGNYAFYGCDGLTTLTVPASVTRIGKYALAESTAVVTFAEGSSLAIIDDFAFAGNVTTSITLPNSVKEIGEGAFQNSKLTTLSVDSNSALESIGRQAFVGSGITSIYLPAALEDVGVEAFKNVTTLSSVSVADGETVLKLSNSAFEGSGIAEITLPARVYYIGEYAFGSCPNLQNIHVDSASESYTSLDGVLCDIYSTTLIQYPGGRSGAYEVPQQITVLTYASFKNNKGLTEVTFAEDSAVKTIGWETFSGCSNLTKITVPDTVVSFDFYVFENCTALTDVILGESTQLNGVYKGAFYGCTALTNITLPDAVEEIGEYAFYNCSSLTQVPLSESAQVKGIYDYAFSGCSGITQIPAFTQLVEVGEYAFAYTSIMEYTVTASVKEIATNAFTGCENFTTIYCDAENTEYTAIDGALYEKGADSAEDVDALVIWPYANVWILGEGKTELTYEDTVIFEQDMEIQYAFAETVTSIGERAFAGRKGLHSISIPDTIASIGDAAFQGCSNLTSAVIPEGVTSIGTSAFSTCSNLLSITIPGSLVNIPDSAFTYCRSLTNVIIPNGVTSIGAFAFEGCSNLTSITIPESIIRIGMYAFYGCSGLETAGPIGGDYNYKFGWMRYIPASAFARCSGLKSITLPESITNIGDAAFAGCSGLMSIIVPESVTCIGTSAFAGCEGLQTAGPIGGGYDYEYGWTNSIPESAFHGLDSLMHVTIPDNMTSIGGNAFYNCSNLTSLTIPESVTSIGTHAFYGCSSLKTAGPIGGGYNYEYGWTEYIPESAFASCESLANITLPDSVTIIGKSTFSYCRSLRSITLPNSVTSIGDYAFNECNSLTSLTIPYNVASIGTHAFNNCSSLTSVSFLGDAPNINSSAFNGVTVTAYYSCYQNTWTSYVMQNYGGTLTWLSFDPCPNGHTEVIDEAVDTDYACITGLTEGAHCSYCGTIIIAQEEIPATADHAFVDGICESCGTESTVYGTCGMSVNWALLTDGTLYIYGSGAMDSYSNGGAPWYSYYSGIQSVVMRHGLTSIGDSAFRGCSSLTSVTIPESVSSIGYYAFQDCIALTSIVVPESVTKISSYAFQNCNGLKTAGQIGSGCNYEYGWTENIPDCAFMCCFSLANVELPDGITRIGGYAFYECEKLTSITIPESVTQIGSSAFSKCGSLTGIKIPDNMVRIDAGVFKLCSSMTSITIPANVTSIGNSAFYGCTSLMDISLPENVTSIGKEAFSRCTSLTNIALPESVISIGDSAFSGCTSMTSITLPKNVTSIGSGVFSGCGSLTEIDVAEGNVTYKSIDGILYASSNNELLSCPGGYSGEVVVPDGVTSISDSAFSGCSSVTSITLPESVTSIGKYVFQNCSSLASITIPENVTSIGNYAFQGCSRLKDITIPESVTSISNYAFQGCTGLMNIVLPQSLSSIGHYAFQGCISLTDITIPEGVPCISNSVFDGCSSLTSITIPESVTSIGYASFEDCSSLTSITIPESVTSIAGKAFEGCSSLTSISIPESVTSIEEQVFRGCSSLTSITIPEGVTSIGRNAFRECLSLTSITIPRNVISIGSDVFGAYGTSSLTSITFQGDVPSIKSDTFNQVTAVAYYSCYNDTWTADVMQNYGGMLTWISYDPCEDGHDYKDVITVPTCTEQGYTTHICSDCGDFYTDSETEAIGHDWADATCTAPKTCSSCGETEGEDLGHSYESVVTAPTCTEDGYSTHTCTRCDDSYVDTYVDALGHDFGEWETTKEATCTEDGEQRRDCDRCDHFEIKAVDKLGHDYKAVVTAPTCTEDGYTTHTCTRCDDTYTDTPVTALGHNFGEWETTKEATCTEDGEQRRDCSRCEHFETKVVTKLGHDYESVVTAPTCTEDGYTTHTCTRCDDSYVDAPVAAPGHNLGNWETTKEATCTEDGEQRRDCDRCDHYETQVVTKLGHDYKVVVTEPTCTEDGYTTHTCSRCDDSYTDTPVDALGHDWDEGKVTVEPTEESTGEMLYTCERCGETKTEVIPELDHIHSYEAVVTAPTCTEQGYTTYTCRCGDSYVQDYVDALGHDMGAWETTKEATCTEDGERRRDCDRCDHYETQVVNALGHDYVDGICTRCGEKDPNYEEPVPGTASVIRLSGKNRYQTAFAVANQLKELMGVQQFSAVVVAYGQNFPDALTGSYLAAVKNAPILLTEASADASVLEYIQANLFPGGKVYILGGTAAVSENFENIAKAMGFDVERLKGKNRYITNLEILKEAGVNSTDEVLIATGTNYADSLSASATGLPMLLVGTSLTEDQKAFLATTSGKFVIIGGTGAVSEEIEAQLNEIGSAVRVKGKNRYGTSVAIAQRYFTNPEAAVLAYAQGFPDGLCGGPLAVSMGAPLILTSNESHGDADAYVENILIGAVTGGTGRISDDTVREIFDLAAEVEIPKK